MVLPPFYRLRLLIALVGDASFAVIAYKFAFFLRKNYTLWIFSNVIPMATFKHINHYFPVLIVIQIVSLYFFGFYDSNRGAKSLLAAIGLNCLMLVSFYYFIADYNFPRSVFMVYGVIDFCFLAAFRAIMTRIFTIPLRRRNVLIVGTNQTAKSILWHLSKRRDAFHIIGFVDTDPSAGAHRDDIPIVGGIADIPRLLERYKVDELIISHSNSWLDDLIDLLARSQNQSRLTVVPSPYELLIGKLRHIKIHDIPLIEIYKEPVPLSRLMGKRIFDLVFAVLLVAAFSPLYFLVACLVKLTSKGPVLYKQIRLGENQEPFTMYKFRTMVANAEAGTGPVLAAEDDKRVTAVGRVIRKLRLDELPQLFNIIKGDMSFVGPRPERKFFVDQFMHTIKGYAARFKAKPGLTGLAQISGEYSTRPENKLKYDLAYIYNQNILLDLLILFETVKVVFTLKGSR